MVELDTVTKVFHPGEANEVVAVRQVSLSVPEGQFLVVIGGNGSGKSTLLNLIAGTFLADRGSIAIDGRNVTKVPEHRRAAMIGRVFQDPLMGTSAGLTIEENFALAAARGEFRGLGRAVTGRLRNEIRDRLALLKMDLENRLKAKVGLLSGGQRQAITVLMAVFREPRVLLLDEHTAALDPRASKRVLDLSREIVRDRGLTTLMITHNLAHALEVGDRAIIMSRGVTAHDLGREALDSMDIEGLFALFRQTQRREERDALA